MIALPNKPKVVLEEDGRAVFEIEGLYPGYGVTLGNALRRVLLSSLRGAAVTSFKVKGASHEFSTLPGVAEDLVEISLNLKRLRLKLFSDEPQKLALVAKGEKVVKAKDIEKNAQVEIINPDLVIATLTAKNAELEFELTVERGIGYRQVEEQKKEKLPIGVIAIDAMFSPVKKVNFEIENMRVGDRTDYNRLRLHIETDNTLLPREALDQATQILLDHFSAIQLEKGEEKSSAEVLREGAKDLEKADVSTLELSKRTTNALVKAGIKTIGSLSHQSLKKLKGVQGLGEKGMSEIKKALSKHGFEVKE
jgi:DNA-directed RNA polymerase subunit alpha